MEISRGLDRCRGCQLQVTHHSHRHDSVALVEASLDLVVPEGRLLLDLAEVIHNSRRLHHLVLVDRTMALEQETPRWVDLVNSQLVVLSAAMVVMHQYLCQERLREPADRIAHDFRLTSPQDLRRQGIGL